MLEQEICVASFSMAMPDGSQCLPQNKAALGKILHCSRVDLDFDHYKRKTIKSKARSQRVRGKKTIRRDVQTRNQSMGCGGLDARQEACREKDPSELTAIGEKLGLSGSDLAYFIKEQQEFERAKRAEQRDAEREQMEAEKAILAEKRALMEADKERLELEITLKSSKSDETSMNASVPAKFSDKWGTKLIPKFSESDVGKIFVAFEKVAHQLAWPKELWAVLVQSAFSGKAQVVYAALGAEDSGDYDIVKKMVLNAYQLIPEAYRQKFRSWRKMFNQTFVEWAGQKAVKLDEWLAAEEASTFAQLRELVLLEDFKNNIPKDVRIHIEEFNIDNVNEAAKAADRFVLSHKHCGKKKTHWEAGVEKVEVIKGRESPSSPSRGARQARDIVCYKCGKKGHVKSHCPEVTKSVKPVILMDCRSVPPVSSSLEGEVSGSMPYGKEFEDFVFRGIVKVGSEAIDGNIVALLRDTGSCQSCILETSLPKDFSRKGQDFVLLGGFPDTVTSWPVEEVYLESPLVTGRLKLAVVNALPVSGVDLLIGNDVMQGSGTACALEGRKGASVVNERVMVNVKPVVPVTRAQSREEVKGGEADVNLENCFQTRTQPKTTKDRQTLISAQKEDRELKSIYEEAEQLKEQDDLSEASYVLKNDVLYRLIRPVTAATDEEWKLLKNHSLKLLLTLWVLYPKPKTGFQYMLTIMDRTTRFPEVIPVRCIKSGIVIKHLMDFFSRYGLPREIQSDQGSNFTSREFQAKMNELGIKHNLASSYHPESQGILERFHSTLKNALTKYCLDHVEEWDKDLPLLLFALRSAPSESLGFSPFQMVYGHNVRGPLDLLREHWEGGSGKMNSLDYILSFKEKLRSIWQWAQNNLSTSQAKMKTHYDRKSQVRNFEAGEQVLVLLPMPGQFRAQFVGPAVVKKKLNDVDYLVEIPGRRKKCQLCHINIMKKYFSRANTVKSVSAVVPKECNGQEVESKEYGWNGENSKILCNPDSLFKHLNAQEATDIKDLFKEHPSIFKDTPGLVRSLQHDVVLKPNAQPIRQAPYRLSPQKAEAVRKEVSYMLENDLISPSSSPWSSPVVLVKKENGQDRLCFDYRKVNDLTVADNFPLPRIEDCIDKIGNAKYISKLDLLIGYWQVPLTENAREISAFITPEGLFECKVMPFGMRNAASTFQRMMWMITNGLKGCVVYLDDIIIFSDNWKDHVDRIRALFRAIADAGLVVNLSKCEFGKAEVIYLGHHVGQGKVLPKEKNIEAVLAFPTPKTRKNVRQFVGLAGYYRRFVPSFSEIVTPLTNLLREKSRFLWDDTCQRAFDKLKGILSTYPILKSPDFQKGFKLMVDASDLGVGAVLLQDDSEGGNGQGNLQ
ncbi:uncharacterized protein [Palaemon carinicauda]|uniref:uncharacterized protein n=1 Tax=Palaemon carinicauda TaxID=392227 RepID=UPI0035B664B0